MLEGFLTLSRKITLGTQSPLVKASEARYKYMTLDANRPIHAFPLGRWSWHKHWNQAADNADLMETRDTVGCTGKGDMGLEEGQPHCV